MFPIYQLLLSQILIECVAPFVKAPGNLTVTIKMSDMISICTHDECQYHIEFCIGSGRSKFEQCMWLPKKSYSGKYSDSLASLAQQSFEVDNVRASFYFNSNLTFTNARNISKTMQFKDMLIKYDVPSGTYSTSLHSLNFEALSVDIDAICKSGFYPPFQCTKSCFGVTGISYCDTNGSLICSKGYVRQLPSEDCVYDKCKSSLMLCKNNSTCSIELNSIKCQCQLDYRGLFCEEWDPCPRHQCQNGGYCIKRSQEIDYICQCFDSFSGKYCENVVDPCTRKRCPTNSMCELRHNDAVCVPQPKSQRSDINLIGWFRKKADEKKTSNIPVTKSVMSLTIDEIEVKNRETVKLIQYPVQKDFTTISIIIVLLIFLICCFGVTFWMQRYKYFKKRKTYNSYPNIPPLPSVIQMPTYRSADESFKRWHSLDDSSFYLCHQPPTEQFSTMSYKSGSNIWPKYDNSHDIYRDSYKNWPPSFRNRMPMMNESSNYESSDNAADLCESTPNNLEKMEDYVTDALVMDNTTGHMAVSSSSYN